MCGWKCPLRFENRKQYGFLLCKKLMKSGVDYNKRENALQSICAFQYKCPKTGLQENTESAKRCYKHQSAVAVDIGGDKETEKC